ncbi:hypothetical protein [Burkholderia sp. BE17]|uniref:hypothetical protein n=1 Tax=Burkholderia sp. BE17 TaxID=2656644 RepID=UPI00128CEDFB|nr:hypothetical protein [Burkholderia sp. BE17]MPV68132.1 hypothetical protein [Burkholderia sp. BE17]
MQENSRVKRSQRRTSLAARRCSRRFEIEADAPSAGFLPTERSALSDPSTVCTVRSTAIDADDTYFALMDEGRYRFSGTAYSLINEIYVLRDGQPVLVKSNSADF